MKKILFVLACAALLWSCKSTDKGELIGVQVPILRI